MDRPSADQAILVSLWNSISSLFRALNSSHPRFSIPFDPFGIGGKRERLKRERVIISLRDGSLDCAGTQRVYDIETSVTHWILSIRYIEGRTLSRVLSRL